MSFLQSNNTPSDNLLHCKPKLRVFLILLLCLQFIGGFNPVIFAEEPPEELTQEDVLDIMDFFSFLGALSFSEEAAPSEERDQQGNPFTPPGKGTVIDNAVSTDGKEFFTITTEQKHTFYLVIDRERSVQNVYLLREVNEEDLYDFVSVAPQEVVEPEKEEASPSNPLRVKEPGSTDAPMDPKETTELEEVLTPAKPILSHQQILAIVVLVVTMVAVAVVLIYRKRLSKLGQSSYEVDEYGEYDDEEDEELDDDLEESEVDME